MLQYTGVGFPDTVMWSVWEVFSFWVPEFLFLLTSDCCDSETPILRFEIFFPPRKKVVLKDGGKSPLFFTIFPQQSEGLLPQNSREIY